MFAYRWPERRGDDPTSREIPLDRDMERLALSDQLPIRLTDGVSELKLAAIQQVPGVRAPDIPRHICLADPSAIPHRIHLPDYRSETATSLSIVPRETRMSRARNFPDAARVPMPAGVAHGFIGNSPAGRPSHRREHLHSRPSRMIAFAPPGRHGPTIATATSCASDADGVGRRLDRSRSDS